MPPLSLIELSNLSFADLCRIQAKAGALRLPNDKSVAVLRHTDVVDAFTNRGLTVRHRFRASLRLFGPTIIELDGPDHQRQREPIVRGLVDGRAELIHSGKIDDCAARAVADLRGRRELELIDELAVRLATEVMAILTGLSPKEALHLYRLYRSVVEVVSGNFSAFEAAKANLLEAMNIYDSRHRSGALSHALESALKEKKLSAPEVDRHRIMVFLAGTETTVCATSNMIWMLATDGNLLHRFRNVDPVRLDAAVTEVLRFQPPIFSMPRFAASSLDICGISVKVGTPVHLCLAAACRDPDRFPNPHHLKLSRPGSTNLMFGHGDHFCPGSSIAKQEVKAVLRVLMDEVRDIRLLDDPPPTVSGHLFRTPGKLDASIDWVAM